MKIDRQKAKRVFGAYVQNYDCRDEKIRLKIEHTYRVASLCAQIAESERLSAEDVDLAWLIGLLHDIGRFEQLRQYGTFIDADSVDPAELGADILFKQGKIREFVTGAGCDRLIELAVRAHSLYRLPEGLDGRETMFCDIIRDADKVDILRVNVEFAPEDIYNVSSEVLRNEEVTPDVMQSFFEEHATLRSLKKTAVDHLAGHISLIYELVYPYSVKVMAEQGFLEKMLAFKSENPHTREQFAVIADRINGYVKKRLEEMSGEE